MDNRLIAFHFLIGKPCKIFLEVVQAALHYTFVICEKVYSPRFNKVAVIIKITTVTIGISYKFSIIL